MADTPDTTIATPPSARRVREARGDGRRLLTILEVASELQCSKDTVRRLGLAGKLRYTIVGNQWRFRPEWVAAYVDRDTL